MNLNKIGTDSRLFPTSGDVVRELIVEIELLQAKYTGELSQTQLDMIYVKCVRYWNDPVELYSEECHLILEFIYKLARYIGET